MAEYDNTNSGAAFKPFDTQRMILQGKLNVDSDENKVILVADRTKAGMQIIEVYKRLGVMFNHDKKDNEKAPDYSGPIDNSNLKLAGWKRDKEGKRYMSLQVSESQQKSLDSAPSVPPLQLDDEIPLF